MRYRSSIRFSNKTSFLYTI